MEKVYIVALEVHGDGLGLVKNEILRIFTAKMRALSYVKKYTEQSLESVKEWLEILDTEGEVEIYDDRRAYRWKFVISEHVLE